MQVCSFGNCDSFYLGKVESAAMSQPNAENLVRPKFKCMISKLKEIT